MQLFGKNLDTDVVYVAEIGVNHEGNLEYAKELMALAAKAGADAVKFQSYTPERYASSSNPARLERVTRFSLSEEQHQDLIALAKTLDIHFFSTPLSEDWVDKLDASCSAFKIASGDITFEAVIRNAARTQKPVIISTGGATIEEIDQAVQWFKEEVGEGILKERLILMQCICAYPAPIEHANVLGIDYLRDRYELRVGYSNHIVSPEACYAAIARNAPVIEVHFTDNKHDRDFHDHLLSFEPQDFEELVKTGNLIKASLGAYEKRKLECELDPPLVRKGVIAANDLAPGHVLTREDLMFARPATEIPAANLTDLIGKKISNPYKRGEQIQRSELE